MTGKISGGSPDRLDLYVNDIATEVSVSGGSFQATVPLQAGRNRLRAVVTGPGDVKAEDSISIEYVLPSLRVALTSPADGFVLSPEAPPVVVVEGEVEDKAVTTLWLVVNGRRIPVTASEGRFRKIVPFFESTLRIWAETSAGGEKGSRSQPVTIHAAGPRRPSAVLVMEWPKGTQGLEAEVTAVWRSTPNRLDGPTQPVSLPGVLKQSEGGPVEVFWLRSVWSGVYTITLRHRGSLPTGDLLATLYIPDKDGITDRPLAPVRLGMTGKAVVTRVLLPEGVLWEQEGYFTGKSESAETITKFRFPEGIGWVERKSDLR